MDTMLKARSAAHHFAEHTHTLLHCLPGNVSLSHLQHLKQKTAVCCGTPEAGNSSECCKFTCVCVY